jgi:histidine phosphotransferase ChpT
MSTQNPGFAADTLPCAANLDLLSLVATRLCHDLSGPIGALAAGSELLGDPDFLEETSALLSHSSAGAMARLRLLRAAFGIAGGGAIAFEDTLSAYGDALYGNDVTLGFSLDSPHLLSEGLRRQVALNMVLLVLDVMPGRGSVDVTTTLSAPTDATGPMADHSADLTISVEGRAKRLVLPPTTADALAGNRDGLTARSVQAYWLFALSHGLGGIELWQGEGTLRLSARLPTNDV